MIMMTNIMGIVPLERSKPPFGPEVDNLGANGSAFPFGSTPFVMTVVAWKTECRKPGRPGVAPCKRLARAAIGP